MFILWPSTNSAGVFRPASGPVVPLSASGSRRTTIPPDMTFSHEISRTKKYLYYLGLRGNRHFGPKLVFRTSTDVFTPPTGPANDARVMQLIGVHDNKLGQDNLWATIRGKVREPSRSVAFCGLTFVPRLLNSSTIERSQHTSVDLARFRWDEQYTDGGRKTVTSRVTIWIECCLTVPPATPRLSPLRTSSNSSSNTTSVISTWCIVNRWPGLSLVPSCWRP